MPHRSMAGGCCSGKRERRGGRGTKSPRDACGVHILGGRGGIGAEAICTLLWARLTWSKVAKESIVLG